MSAMFSGSVSPEAPAAARPPTGLRVLFIDVAAEDQVALETLCPGSWRPRFLPDTQIDADGSAAALVEVLCVFIHTPVTRELLRHMPALRL
ncbi:MAG: hypothetical protein ACOY7P_06095, partial [Pseudomonadota bacterium]